LGQQEIRVPASFWGKNREGAAPDFQVHMPPSGVIAGKWHGTVPYEQNIQQSPGFGLKRSPQPLQS
jgi:hypothetical protein